VASDPKHGVSAEDVAEAQAAIAVRLAAQAALAD
jgi:hypothetical protein